MRTKPKKLTLHQIHELYLLLKPYLPEKEEKYLIDEARYILEHAKPGTMQKSFEIMYGKTLKVNPIEAATLFLRGLKNTNFFSYTEFLRNLHGR